MNTIQTVEESLKEDKKVLTKRTRLKLGKELIEESKPDHMYFVMLFLSAVIISAGILVESSAVIIGGMLVAPLLTPILVFGYGLALQDMELTKAKGKLVMRSIMAILIGSFALGIVFASSTQIPELKDSLPAALLYFIVAFSSGIAASYSWIYKKSHSVLPGIAIVASLAPPLAYAGISFALVVRQLSGSFFELGIDYITLFILNFIGIVMGSFIVFLLLGFNATMNLKEAKKK